MADHRVKITIYDRTIGDLTSAVALRAQRRVGVREVDTVAPDVLNPGTFDEVIRVVNDNTLAREILDSYVLNRTVIGIDAHRRSVLPRSNSEICIVPVDSAGTLKKVSRSLKVEYIGCRVERRSNRERTGKGTIHRHLSR